MPKADSCTRLCQLSQSVSCSSNSPYMSLIASIFVKLLHLLVVEHVQQMGPNLTGVLAHRLYPNRYRHRCYSHYHQSSNNTCARKFQSLCRKAGDSFADLHSGVSNVEAQPHTLITREQWVAVIPMLSTFGKLGRHKCSCCYNHYYNVPLLTNEDHSIERKSAL